MALTNDDLQAIASLLDTKMNPIEKRLDNIEEDISSLKTDVSTLKSDLTELKETVNKNYDMLEEFYVYQKEQNTEVSNSLSIVEGELEMHNNQIARNTAQLKRVK